VLTRIRDGDADILGREERMMVVHRENELIRSSTTVSVVLPGPGRVDQLPAAGTAIALEISWQWSSGWSFFFHDGANRHNRSCWRPARLCSADQKRWDCGRHRTIEAMRERSAGWGFHHGRL
jgi:hypothetical protein